MKGSLRARLFAGALVWMTAVFVTVTALLLKLARNHPELGLHGATYHVVMGIFVLAFVVGGLFLVRRAVAPLWSLRASLSAVREGRSQRIEGDHPSEVQPLVNELNGLLEIVHRLEESTAHTLEACGVPWERLDAAEAERRYPVRVPAEAFAVSVPVFRSIRTPVTVVVPISMAQP